MQGIVYSKIQVVTHHYQRFSCSRYLLLVQVQAQQKVSKCPHMKNDSIFTHRGLPLFSNQLLIRLTQDQKGLSNACNGVECKVLLSHLFYSPPWIA
ncbi:hypothetical protein H5410_001749 [Solanum commersonii]|uniref:Uncharacterized protein n=1 Tax=Solanum commersonii TaxID=4109 RepID=A0A9J6AZX5_SOLCO|nr:hypothetical protein H5410_001749 [Solanum commersonii]